MLYLPTPANRGQLLALPALVQWSAALNGTWASLYGSNPPGDGTAILWWLANMHRYILNHAEASAAALIPGLYAGLRSNLMNHGLRNGTDGLLHALNCYSPEYTVPCPSGGCVDCSYVLAIYRWGAQTAAELARVRFPGDTAARAVFDDLVARIAPYPIDAATGSWAIAANLPYAVPHRHYSHLLQLFDLNTAGGQLADARAMGPSLDLWWNVTCAGPQAAGHVVGDDDQCRGFTQAGMAAMSARLNRTDAARGNLTSFLKLCATSNAQYGEDVYKGQANLFAPVAESAYSAAASLYGMLLSSSPWPPVAQAGGFNDSAVPTPLRIWPGAPWANVSLFRARGEGAFLVSAVRLNGATLWVAVEADDGAGTRTGESAPFVLYCPDWRDASAVAVNGPAGVAASPVAGQAGTFLVTGLTRGGAVTLQPAGVSPPQNPPFAVSPAPGRNASLDNFWGGRFVYDVTQW